MESDRGVALLTESSRNGSHAQRFPIAFDPWYARLSRMLGLAPAGAYLDIDAAAVHVRMNWAFRARFPRAAVARAAVSPLRPLSRGVHGFNGRWLVNGSARNIVALDLAPTQRAYVLGFPVRLRQLLVSVDDPRALLRALTR